MTETVGGQRWPAEPKIGQMGYLAHCRKKLAFTPELVCYGTIYWDV